MHAEKMITACQESEKLCKISMTARKLHSMELSCQRDSILVAAAIKTKLQVAAEQQHQALLHSKTENWSLATWHFTLS